MNKSVTLILMLSSILIPTVWILIVRSPDTVYAQDGDILPDQNDVETVIIALTRLDVNDLIPDVNNQIPNVNDQILELRHRIVNYSENDIWFSGDVSLFHPYQEEVYLDKDDETLVIRRRFDVPTDIFWVFQPVSKYVRLCAGEDWTETLSLTLPVRPSRLFTFDFQKGIKYARRLVVEIGYHTKDLPREVGRWEPYPDPNAVEEVEMDYYDSAKKGEHVLRITVDGALIPYEEVPADLANTKGKEEKELESR